jgi:hypothetical protein
MNKFRAQLERQVLEFVTVVAYDAERKWIKEELARFREVQLTKSSSADVAEVKDMIKTHINEQGGKELAVNRMLLVISLGSGAFGALLAWLLTHK